MQVGGIVDNGKANGEYVIYLFDLDDYENELFTLEGEFSNITYDRNLKTNIQVLIDTNHSN
ncbi:hypothetical protein DS745_07160 [Anaerobacillus alkaliphilus]|uniref:Uncharacterized protein n=2 Tax=Anaerobacillus alkaliphilus TaxID=1548597 RepID=A0A4Q0VU10_9BACI|nr:hypothetical protein DS745_07160 [Anaerobacillus alkaliphilus]